MACLLWPLIETATKLAAEAFGLPVIVIEVNSIYVVLPPWYPLVLVDGETLILRPGIEVKESIALWRAVIRIGKGEMYFKILNLNFI